MAIINILAKSQEQINWVHFITSCSKLNLTCVEIFPIPKNIGFDDDCVGVAVHQGYPNKEDLLNELTKLIDFLIQQRLKIIELYDSVEVTSDNIIMLANKLLL